MIVNTENLHSLFVGFSAAFKAAFESTPAHVEKLAMMVKSSTSEELYAWLGQFPGLREWIGDRHIKGISAHSLRIVNRKFESTIEVPREKIEDDQYGVFSPLVSEVGRNARVHPDLLIFELIQSGFTELGYDGQPFFDTDHPVKDGVVSNVQAGGETPWYLLDLSKAVRPFIFQERMPYDLTRVDRPDDDHVFMKDSYLFGVRARVNAGFGLWQLAFGSKAALDGENYEAARTAMMGLSPTHLLVPPSLEGAGRRLLNSQLKETESGSVSNEWAGSAELIVTPYLS
jgi:phage major head subunit gpT-like protein